MKLKSKKKQKKLQELVRISKKIFKTHIFGKMAQTEILKKIKKKIFLNKIY